MRNIQGDLAKGKEGEKMALHQFTRCGATGGLNDDKETRYEYDIYFELNEKKWTVEVKYDQMANKTGNIAVETFNPKLGKTSGIARTKADLWMHILSESEVYLARVEDLKKFISENEPDKIIDRGGDKNAKLYIYAKKFITKIAFKNIATLSNKQLKKFLKEWGIE